MIRSFFYMEPETLSNWEELVLKHLSRNSLENILYDNLETLINNAKKVNFAKRYEMRPDIVSWEYYGSDRTWPLITIVNRCGSLFYFTPENVGEIFYVPNPETVEKILNEL